MLKLNAERSNKEKEMEPEQRSNLSADFNKVSQFWVNFYCNLVDLFSVRAFFSFLFARCSSFLIRSPFAMHKPHWIWTKCMVILLRSSDYCVVYYASELHIILMCTMHTPIKAREKSVCGEIFLFSGCWGSLILTSYYLFLFFIVSSFIFRFVLIPFLQCVLISFVGRPNVITKRYCLNIKLRSTNLGTTNRNRQEREKAKKENERKEVTTQWSALMTFKHGLNICAFCSVCSQREIILLWIGRPKIKKTFECQDCDGYNQIAIR